MILERKAAIDSGCDDHNDILSMMLKFELENPDYTIEEQVDDFLTFIVAGVIDRNIVMYRLPCPLASVFYRILVMSFSVMSVSDYNSVLDACLVVDVTDRDD